jgi:hypothetical protein
LRCLLLYGFRRSIAHEGNAFVELTRRRNVRFSGGVLSYARNVPSNARLSGGGHEPRVGYYSLSQKSASTLLSPASRSGHPES